MRFLIAIVLLGSSVVSGAESPRKTPDALSLLMALGNGPELLGALGRLKYPDSAKLFEGLPHPVLEQSHFEREAKRSELIWIHQIPFYPIPLEIGEDDRKRLLEILSDPQTYLIPDVPHQCGGFHPDYALVWTDRSAGELRIMICLGCGEAVICNDSRSTYKYLKLSVHRELNRLLKGYRVSRPEAGESVSFSLDPEIFPLTVRAKESKQP